MRRAEGEGEMSDARQLDKMTATRSNRWTPEEDDAFRKMAEANIRPRTDRESAESVSSRCQGSRLRNRDSVEMVQAEGEGEKWLIRASKRRRQRAWAAAASSEI
jgi:hypothetical protein